LRVCQDHFYDGDKYEEEDGTVRIKPGTYPKPFGDTKASKRRKLIRGEDDVDDDRANNNNNNNNFNTDNALCSHSHNFHKSSVMMAEAGLDKETLEDLCQIIRGFGEVWTREIPLEAAVVLCLTCLRIGLSHSSLFAEAVFNLSRSTISRLLYSTLPLVSLALELKFKGNSFLKYDQSCLPNLPTIFLPLAKREVPIHYIIDCFEVPIERPTDTVLQKAYWSSYKHCHTIKYLIALSAKTNRIAFISAGFPGGISDNEIIKSSGFLDILLPGENILADKGFTCDTFFTSVQCCLIVPAFLRTGMPQLSAVEEVYTQRIASVRIFVEHAVLRVKGYSPLFHKRNAWQHRYLLDLVASVAAFMFNFQGDIIPSRYYSKDSL